MSKLVTEFGEMLTKNPKESQRIRLRSSKLCRLRRGSKQVTTKMWRGLVNIKLEALYKLKNTLNCELF